MLYFFLVFLFYSYVLCIKNKVQLVETDSCPAKLDLVFVLDTSGSIDEVYDEQIHWVKSLVDSLPISEDAARVAAIQYAGSPIVEFSLNSITNKNEVLHRLDAIQFHSGVTRTGMALRAAEEELFSERKGARVNSSKIVILFTDGLSIDDPDTPSNHLRDVRGVNIYVVSVGTDGFVPEMQKIAGDVENVYGPSDLIRFKEHFMIDVEASRRCSTVEPPSTTTESPKTSLAFVPFRRRTNRPTEQTSTISTSTTSVPFIATTTQTLPTTSVSSLKTSLPPLSSALPKRKKKIRVVRRKIRKNLKGDDIVIKAGKRVRRVIRRKIRTTTTTTTTPLPETTTTSFSAPANSTECPRRAKFRLIKKKSTTTTVPTSATSALSSSAETTTSATQRTTKSLTTRSTSTTASPTTRPSTKSQTLPTLATIRYSRQFTKRVTLEPKSEIPKAFAAKNQIIDNRGECPMDILFVVDSSGSVGAVYEKQKAFLSSILEAINPEEHSHRVALIQFAGARLQKIQWTFDSFSQNGEIMRAFNNLRHFTGTTYIGAALETTVSQLFTRRPNVPTITIVISDGFSHDDVRTPAHRIRSMEHVELYVASLAPLNNIATLLEIAGDETKLFTDGDVEILRTRLLNRFQCQN